MAILDGPVLHFIFRQNLFGSSLDSVSVAYFSIDTDIPQITNTTEGTQTWVINPIGVPGLSGNFVTSICNI